MQCDRGQVMAESLSVAQTRVFSLSQTEPLLHRRLANQDRARTPAPDWAVEPAQGREWGNSWHSPLAQFLRAE
jgi:hypothetical protein